MPFIKSTRLTFAFLLLLFSACQPKTPTLHILALGDSNGAREGGWVDQLQKQRPDDKIFNLSISGNTIGFDNLDRDTLNTLANIEEYLAMAGDSLKQIDQIIVMLGTNDCKAVYDTLQQQVVTNMDELINYLQQYAFRSGSTPKIMMVSPPPMSADSLMEAKYAGGCQCVEQLLPNFQSIARAHHTAYVDIFHALQPDYDSLTVDGVHLNEEGYQRVAKLIDQHL